VFLSLVDITESPVTFLLDDWDVSAEIPTMHLSFILRTILPKTQTNLTSQRTRLDKEGFRKVIENIE